MTGGPLAIHGQASNFDQSAATPGPIRVCENQVEVRADRDLAHSLIKVASVKTCLKPPRWSLLKDGLVAQRIFQLHCSLCNILLLLQWLL